MLEMVPGFHTQKIVEEIFRLSENTSKSAPSSDNTRFDWLEKYINSDAGMECLPKYYTVLQGCRKRRGGGIWGGFSPSPVFGRTVNPISTRGQIMPTTVLRAPRIFRPCDGPVLSGMPEYTGTWGFVPIIFWQIHEPYSNQEEQILLTNQ